MSSLRSTFRKLNRWRRKVRSGSLDRETRLAIEQTFDVRPILKELHAPTEFPMAEEMAVHVLGLMVTRQFVIERGGDEGGDPICDWKRMAESVVDAIRLGGNCGDPAIRGVAAFLHFANLTPASLANMVRSSSDIETIVFAIIVLSSFIAWSHSIEVFV